MRLLSTIVIVIVIAHLCHCRSIPVRRQVTPRPSIIPELEEDEQDDQDVEPEDNYDADCSNLEESFRLVQDTVFGGAMSKQAAKRLLYRTIESIDNPKRFNDGSSRNHNLDNHARNLADLLTQTDSQCPSSITTSQTDNESQDGDATYEPCEDYQPNIGGQPFSLKTMQAIVDMADKGKSTRTIQASYRRYRPQYLKRFRERIAGNCAAKWQEVDEFVWSKVQEVRTHSRKPLHDCLLRRWALEHAERINFSRFRASHYWILSFKRRRGLTSRKVTRKISRAQRRITQEILASINQFKINFNAISTRFPRNLIWNTDQSPFKYEISNERTLSFTGEQDTELNIDSENKNTHSYTVQATVSRDGRTIGPILLCLQEDTGDEFGVRVGPEVRALEERYKNIRVFSSRSGLMSKGLVKKWVNEVILPALDREPPQNFFSSDNEDEAPSPFNERPPAIVLTDQIPGTSSGSSSNTRQPNSQEFIAVNRFVGISPDIRPELEQCANPFVTIRAINGSADDEYEVNRHIAVSPNSRSPDPVVDDRYAEVPIAGRRPEYRLLLVLDSWSGHSSKEMIQWFREQGIEILVVPKHTTSKLQPLDLEVYRQWKKLVKKLHEEALYLDEVSEVTSRNGAINMQSLIWNQLSAPAYRDLFTYAWRNADVSFSPDELEQGIVSARANKVNFDFDPRKPCEVHYCDQPSFIQCAFCKKHLCFEHFLGRMCFHEAESDDSSQNEQSGQDDN